MNKWGRKVLKAVVLCGTIVAGILWNSSDAKAAEVEATDDVQPVQAEDNQGEQETTHSAELVQKLEDIVEVIEGDAVAEEGYNNQAQNEIDNNSLDQDKADELLAGGEAVLDQATEKKSKSSLFMKRLIQRSRRLKQNLIHRHMRVI